MGAMQHTGRSLMEHPIKAEISAFKLTTKANNQVSHPDQSDISTQRCLFFFFLFFLHFFNYHIILFTKLSLVKKDSRRFIA